MKDEILMQALYIKSALEGLETFMYNNFDAYKSITLDDVDQLNGLIKAVVALSDKNVADIERVINI